MAREKPDAPEPEQPPPLDTSTRAGEPMGAQFQFVTKLGPEVQAEVVKALRAGAPPEAACAFAGIVRATYYDWLRIGRNAIANANGDLPQVVAENPYANFAAAVDHAMAQFVVGAMTQVGLHGRTQKDGDWRALAWQLERRFPALFGKQTKVTGHLTVEHAIVVDPSKLDSLPMERKLLLAEILAELDGEIIDHDETLAIEAGAE